MDPRRRAFADHMGLNRSLSLWVTTCIRKNGWVPFLFFTLHLVVSKGFDAYLILPWLDIPMHFFGGVAIAYFYWTSILHALAVPVLGELSAFGKQLLAVAAVGATTVIWEFAEWFTDQIGLTEAQLSLDDTLLDMALGLLGGAIFVLLAGKNAIK